MDELAPCQSLRKIRVLGIHSSPESATMMWCVDGSVPLAPLLSSNTMFAQTVFEDFFRNRFDIHTFLWPIKSRKAAVRLACTAKKKTFPEAPKCYP